MTIQFILITPAPRFYFLMKDLGIYTRSCALVCFFNSSSSSRVEQEKWGWKRDTVLLLSWMGTPLITERPFSCLTQPICTHATKAFQWLWHGSLWIVATCIRCVHMKKAGWPRPFGGTEPLWVCVSHHSSLQQCLLDLLIWIRWRCCLLFVGSREKINSVQIFQAATYFPSLNL